MALSSWAAGDDWPDQIDFPQKLPKPPVSSVSTTPQSGNISGSTGTSFQQLNDKSEKKDIWPLHRKVKVLKTKPLTEEPITQVGPKDPPAYPDPLMRLTFPIKAGEGVILPGFYLVRQLDKSESERTLALTRKHQIVLQFRVSDINVPSEKSPIETVERTAPPKLSIESQLSPNQKTLTIVLKEGAQRYESQPFPVAVDQRKILSY